MPGAHIWHGPSPWKSELIGISYVPIGAVCSENIEQQVKRFSFIVMGIYDIICMIIDYVAMTINWSRVSKRAPTWRTCKISLKSLCSLPGLQHDLFTGTSGLHTHSKAYHADRYKVLAADAKTVTVALKRKAPGTAMQTTRKKGKKP